MEFTFHKNENGIIAELVSFGGIIEKVGDALDVMAEAYANDSRNIILRKEQLSDDFFELKTMLAGNILQKFVTYGVKLAIVGEFENIESKSLRDFIYESNRVGQIMFLSSTDEALTKL